MQNNYTKQEMLDKVGTYEFLAEPFHCDFSNRLFMGHLGNHLLNAADFHSNDRNFGMNYLHTINKTWVLSRLAIEMEEMPLAYTRFNVETWVENALRFFTNRNFKVSDVKDGKVYGYGKSVWAMIDLETRKPCDLLTLYDGDILRYIVPEEENVCPIEGHGRFRFREPQLIRTIDTYYSDVDINGHINSIKYIEHILDLFPKERFEQGGIRRFEIAYKAESYLGDRLSFYEQTISEKETDIEVRKNEGDVVCQAKVCFK